MMVPLNLWDASLLITLAFILLLVASELLSSRYGRISISINRKRLKAATQVFGIVFVVTVALRVIDSILLT
jgi:hypothetical protein